MNQYSDRIDAAYDGWSAPRPLSFPASAVDQALVGTGVRLCGWNVRETAGAVAVGRFYNSATATQGEIVGGVSLAANAVAHEWLGDRGVICAGGLSFDRISGTVEIVVYIREWIGFQE